MFVLDRVCYGPNAPTMASRLVIGFYNAARKVRTSLKIADMRGGIEVHHALGFRPPTITLRGPDAVN